MEIYSTKSAAEKAGLSITYFLQLSHELPIISPIEIKGCHVVGWTVENIEAIKSRRKRVPFKSWSKLAQINLAKGVR